jgi:hypothetical protein
MIILSNAIPTISAQLLQKLLILLTFLLFLWERLSSRDDRG